MDAANVDRRLDISRYLLSHFEDDPGDFNERVVTQGETLAHHLGPEAKNQSKQWNHPGSPLLRNMRVHSAGNMMVGCGRIG